MKHLLFRFGFQILATTDATKEDEAVKGNNFFCIFRETVMWMRNTEKDEVLRNIVQSVNKNVSKGY